MNMYYRIYGHVVLFITMNSMNLGKDINTTGMTTIFTTNLYFGCLCIYKTIQSISFIIIWFGYID